MLAQRTHAPENHDVRQSVKTSLSHSAVAALWALTCLAGAMFLRMASELFIPIVLAILASYALGLPVRRAHGPIT